jgi:CBS domain-containing protein
MGLVMDILRRKGNLVLAVEPKASVYSALELMAEKNVGALLVVDGDQLVGVFTERDYARKVILKGRSSLDTPVEDIMMREIYGVRLGCTMEECMALMTGQRVRHLPVFEGERVAGIVSMGDVVKQLIDEQDFTIQQLENYIFTRQ